MPALKRRSEIPRRPLAGTRPRDGLMVVGSLETTTNLLMLHPNHLHTKKYLEDHRMAAKLRDGPMAVNFPARTRQLSMSAPINATISNHPVSHSDRRGPESCHYGRYERRYRPPTMLQRHSSMLLSAATTIHALRLAFAAVLPTTMSHPTQRLTIITWFLMFA